MPPKKTIKKSKGRTPKHRSWWRNPEGHGTRRMIDGERGKYAIVDVRGRCECGWRQPEYVGTVPVISIEDWCISCQKFVFTVCLKSDSKHRCPKCKTDI